MATASQVNDQSTLHKLHIQLLEAETQQNQLLEEWEAASLALEAFSEQFK